MIRAYASWSFVWVSGKMLDPEGDVLAICHQARVCALAPAWTGRRKMRTVGRTSPEVKRCTIVRCEASCKPLIVAD